MCLLYNCNRYLQCTMLQTRAAIFPARLNPILGRASLPAPFALACARGAAGASARGAVELDAPSIFRAKVHHFDPYGANVPWSRFVSRVLLGAWARALFPASEDSANSRHHAGTLASLAAWSALQTLHKSSSKAQDAHYFLGGLNHDWVGYYERGVASDQSCINEWNAMDSLESKRPPSPESLTDKEETQLLIRNKLKEIMMSVDIDEVTSKYIRQRLEEDLAMDLYKFKSYIDQEMMTILGQMDAATEIFPHVYLGSEWNASNLEELQNNGVGYILNVTKEIDNFYPGTFDYLNIRVYDDEKTELLKHWDRTFRYIAQVKDKGSKVLVHCKMGISRSASVVIAYAMKAFNMSLDEALSLVKKKRSCIKPNKAFCGQLKTYEGILDASRQRHNILWRSKSETNLKSTSAHANRPTQTNHENNNLSLNDNVDSSNNNDNRHKSSEELTAYEATYNALTVRIPSPCNGDEVRRPKSWSPDDHTAGLLFPQDSDQGGSDFGDSWRRSQSLNTQSWRAHVTVQQRDLRDIGTEGSPVEDNESDFPVAVVEAVNPLYTDNSSESTINEVSELQLSSSVKDRINEFESVQTVSQAAVKKSQNGKKGEVVQLQNTTTSSDDFSDQSSTAELEKAIETFLSPGIEDLQGSEPVVSQTKPAAQKHQAVLVPSHLWQEECSEIEESVDPTESPVGVPKEAITWPAGIVKRQKQDFEDKVKMSDSKTVPSCKDLDSPLSRQSSSSSLSSQFQRVEVIRSPSYGRQDSVGSDSVKRDDPFSAKLDKVFDREERKQQRLSTVSPLIGEVKETPSRNSSWGSFDSAVVLADRDFPSRQSSWGSCDTRGTAGTIASRNSSFGPYDIKQQPLREDPESVVPISNITGTYFEKDCGPFSPGTIRRNRSKNSETKEGIVDDVKMQSSEPEEIEDAMMEDLPQYKPVANVKAYGPAPYKSPVERVPPTDLNDEGMEEIPEGLDCHKNTLSVPVHIPDSTNPSASDKSQSIIISPGAPLGQSPMSDMDISSEKIVFNKTSPVTEDEVPVPGTVKQHKQLLESRTEGIEKEKLVTPNYNRSQSYSTSDTEKKEASPTSQLSRSFSEKRAKFEGQLEGETEEGKVKKITRALEQQKYDEKFQQLRIKGIRKRSHSLERLSTSPTSPGCSTQQFLDQLFDQTQAEVRELEEDLPSEEICVKSLVGKFEDSQEKMQHKVQTRNVRAKSDSSTPDKFVPPVPQRKSSLDYNFKPNLRAQSQPPPTPLRSSASGSSLSPVVKVPIHKPPPGGRGQTCGVEVRQKKQQGKTHPLTKLTRANRENYHTM